MATPSWVEPGDAATLLWYDGRADGPGGSRVYQIAGPLLEKPPRSPYFLLTPSEESAFSGRLYRGEVGVAELRRFLSACTIARGRIDPSMESLVALDEAPALPVVDAWRAAVDRPVCAYLAEISAFLPGHLPIYCSAEAHAAAVGADEAFGRAWVCAECGDPEDMSVFLWTARRDRRVRVCLLIENEAGRLTCHFHPFEFVRGDA